MTKTTMDYLSEIAAAKRAEHQRSLEARRDYYNNVGWILANMPIIKSKKPGQSVTPPTPQALHFSKDLASTANFNLNDTGNFEVLAAGGVPPYTYRWHLDADNHFANDDTNKLSIKFGYAQIDTLFATVIDSAGNVATSNTMTITTIDPTKPTWLQNSVSNMLRNGSYTFKWLGGKTPFTVGVYKHGATLEGTATTTSDREYVFTASSYKPTFYTVAVKDADGKQLTSAIIHIYGVTAEQKTISLEAGSTVNAPDLFDISQWQSVQGYTAGSYTTNGVWASDVNDLHITFPNTGTYTVNAGYFRTGDTTQTLIPELTETVTVTVTVANTPLVITSSPSDTTWKAGSTHNLTVKLSGGKPPYSYQWETSADGQTWQNVTAIPGHVFDVATSTLHFTGVTASDAAHYRCKVSDSAGTTLTTPAFTLTVQ